MCIRDSAYGAGVVHDPMARASARLEATETLPACRGSWLKLSIPRISPTSVSPTGRDISRRTPDRITVTSSQPCTLKGWPVFEQVRHSNHVTGARPRYTTIKVGYAKVVTLGPGTVSYTHLRHSRVSARTGCHRPEASGYVLRTSDGPARRPNLTCQSHSGPQADWSHAELGPAGRRPSRTCAGW